MWLSLFFLHLETTRVSYDGSQLSFTPNLPLFAGDHGGAVIPVPIPNTEVKGSIAEGSASPGRARVGRRQLFFVLSVGSAGSVPVASRFGYAPLFFAFALAAVAYFVLVSVIPTFRKQ